MSRTLDVQKARDRILSVMERDPILAWDLLALREMLEHRSITTSELSTLTGISLTTVRDTLACRGTDLAIRKNVDVLDQAVTKLSAWRGGIPEMCCGVEGYLRMAFTLHDYEQRKEWNHEHGIRPS